MKKSTDNPVKAGETLLVSVGIESIRKDLRGISSSSLADRGHKNSLKQHLRDYRSSFSGTLPDADQMESDLLQMLAGIDAAECGKDGRFQTAYTTFSRTIKAVMSPADETEAHDILDGFSLSINTVWSVTGKKKMGDPKHFEVGASYISTDRYAVSLARNKDDKKRADTRAGEDKKMVHNEEVAARYNLTDTARDQLVLDAVKDLFPNSVPMDVMLEVMERATKDTVLIAKAS